jgi:hypothetical protein
VLERGPARRGHRSLRAFAARGRRPRLALSYASQWWHPVTQIVPWLLASEPIRVAARRAPLPNVLAVLLGPKRQKKHPWLRARPGCGNVRKRGACEARRQAVLTPAERYGRAAYRVSGCLSVQPTDGEECRMQLVARACFEAIHKRASALARSFHTLLAKSDPAPRYVLVPD